MESKRQQKFSKLLQKELADLFLRETTHLFGGAYLGISTVRVSPDLGMARVYLSLINAKDPKGLIKEVQVQTKQIRHLLAQRIKTQVRVIPDLQFYLDDSGAYADRIDKLLAGLHIPPAPAEESDEDKEEDKSGE
jgi:ribosome-binding factor A